MIKRLFNMLKKFCIGVWKELKDWHTLVTFIAVVIVMGATVWVPILFGILTGDKYWYGIAGTIEAIWLGPVPFIPICVAITLGLKKAFKSFKKRTDKMSSRNSKKRLEDK